MMKSSKQITQTYNLAPKGKVGTVHRYVCKCIGEVVVLPSKEPDLQVQRTSHLLMQPNQHDLDCNQHGLQLVVCQTSENTVMQLVHRF